MKSIKTIIPLDSLYSTEEIITVPAGDVVSSFFTVKKQRGDIQAYSVCVASEGATSNELMNSNITISPNGKSSLESANLLRFSEKFRLQESIIYPQFIAGGSNINYTIDNKANTKEVIISIIQYFYFPIQNMEVKETKTDCN